MELWCCNRVVCEEDLGSSWDEAREGFSEDPALQQGLGKGLEERQKGSRQRGSTRLAVSLQETVMLEVRCRQVRGSTSL